MITKDSTILITGAAGFIGSCMVAYLNEQGYKNLILVDAFDHDEKTLNLHHKNYISSIERADFFNWAEKENRRIDFVFHLGARTDTAEFDYAILHQLNVEYSINLWEYCTLRQIPLVYASSAATYGDGSKGYSDSHALIDELIPLNPYGASKNNFDKWVLNQNNCPPFWAGLKFFNVYGPNEYHKARMASVIFHSFNQIMDQGWVKLFKSHKEGYEDGRQLRDFIYVKDICKVGDWLMNHAATIPSAIYNLGTGQARSFFDLVTATYKALNKVPQIVYIDMPLDIRDKYQYYTKAEMKKLTDAGYTGTFYSLEDGVADYVKEYLCGNNYY